MAKFIYQLTEKAKKAGHHSITHAGKNHVYGKDGILETDVAVSEPAAHGLVLKDTKHTKSLDEQAQDAIKAKAAEDAAKEKESLEKWLLKNPKGKKKYDEALGAGMTEAEAVELSGYKN